MQLHKERNIWVIACIYSLSFFMLLVNYGGIYWDDWCILNQDIFPDQIIFETGTWLLTKPLNEFFLYFDNSIFVNRITTFISLFFASIFFYKILEILNPNQSRNIIITLLFSSAPFYAARISFVNSFYTISLFLYMTSLYLYLKPKNNFIKLTSLLLLFLSFTTNSILFFHYVLLGLYFYFFYKSKQKSLKTFFKQHGFTILLPLLFFVFKSVYLKPSGIYASVYNQITLWGLIKGMPLAFASFFIQIKNLFLLLKGSYILVILIFPISLNFLKKLPNIGFSENPTHVKYLIVIGFILTLSGHYPYAVVGKFATKHIFNTRFDLLAMLGFSIFLYGMIHFLYNKFKFKISLEYCYSFLIGVFISANILIYSSFLTAWFKNEALISLMSKNRIIKENSAFLFNDFTFPLTHSSVVLPLNFYELGGISKKALQVTSKLYSTQASISEGLFPNGVVPKDYKERHHYNISTYQNKQFDYQISFIQKKEIPILKTLEFVLINLLPENSFFSEQKHLLFEKYFEIILQKITLTDIS